VSRDICPCYAGTEDGESLYILIQESRSCACMQWSSCCCALEHIVIIVVIDHDGGDAMHACIGTCLEAEAYFVLCSDHLPRSSDPVLLLPRRPLLRGERDLVIDSTCTMQCGVLKQSLGALHF
jgi:hypothetical protein